MSKTVLVVDDEPDLVKFASFRLKYAGYNVITASDGQEGLNLAKQQKPDLIILDVHLPLKNGYEVCRSIKMDNELKNIPIVFFSATSSTLEIEAKVKELNVQGYIRKPFEPQDLIDKVKALIG